MKVSIAAKRVVILLMTMALAVAFVACQAATPKAADPEPGPPGRDAPPAPQRPYVDKEFIDVKLATSGEMAMMTISLVGHFVDPDAEDGDLTYDADSSDTTKVTADVSGSTLTLKAVAEGTARITVKATDKDKLSSSGAEPGARFTVTVMKTVPPVVTMIDDLTLYKADEPVTIPLTKAEADSETGHFWHALPITYTVSTSPEGVVTVAVDNEKGTLTLTARVSNETIVTVTATTADGKPATNEFTVTVMAGSAPQAPVATGTIEPMTLKVDGAPLIVDVSGKFSDSDELTISAASNDEDKATAAAADNMVTVTAVAEGMATITVTATDEGGRSATQTFDVTVAAADPPEPMAPEKVSTIPAENLTAGDEAESIDVSMYFSGDDLIYTARSSNEDAATATVAGSVVMIMPVAEGTATVTVTATNAGGSATQMIAVMVSESEPEQMPPEAEGTIPPMTLMVGGEAKSVNVAGNFSDPEDQMLTFSAKPKDAKVAIASVSDSMVTVTPVAEGSTTITVTATDTDGLMSDPLSFMVTVKGYVTSIELSVDETMDYPFPAGLTLRSANTSVVTVTQKDSTTYSFTAHKKGSTEIEVYKNRSPMTPVSVMVKNRAPKKNAAAVLASNTVHVLTLLDGTDLDAHEEKLGRVSETLYRIDSVTGTALNLDALFDDPDGDALKFDVSSLRKDHAVVAGVKKNGSEVYVEMLTLAEKIKAFEIIVDVMDDDPDNPLSAPPLRLAVRAMDPKAHEYTVVQEGFDLKGLTGEKNVAFRELPASGADSQDSLIFTGGVLFFAEADAKVNAVQEELITPVTAAAEDAVDHVKIETSSNLKFDKDVATNFAFVTDATTLMFKPMKTGSAWIKITYRDVILVGAGGMTVPMGDKAKYKDTSRTLRFMVEKVVENPYTIP